MLDGTPGKIIQRVLKNSASAGPYNAIPSTLLGVGSICGLGPDLEGIHSLHQPCGSLSSCSMLDYPYPSLVKIQTARGHSCTSISLSLSPVWEKEFFVPSVAYSTADAFDTVCRLDRTGTLDEAPQNKEAQVRYWTISGHSRNKT